ncbi:unnamed protein product [Darwinula stevensoni]|uniref:Uncharacterized protein n=1 Tax=Darwinula stevensoni TaxID=69355 RepID=A0A7R9A9F1_9CRUS|nr:unnamed protein product [Darwinula stevensoni]CAG0897296.1 unnamed protein product [Darwinula stevensoni]
MKGEEGTHLGQGLMIFNHMIDLVYFDASEKLKKHLWQLAVDADIQEEEWGVVVMHLFSPLVTTQFMMKKHLKNPIQFIHCQNGLGMAFAQSVEHIFVCIGENQREEELTEKVEQAVFLSRALLGPCLHILKDNKDMANLVRELLLELRTGSHDGNQSLLLEASQRLHVSPDVRQHCMSMTQELNKKLESSTLCPLHVIFTSQTSIASIHS